MNSQTKLPLTITGGCLCGSIRYTITFPSHAEWPPKGNSTCQCTMCRKFTGSPLPQGLALPTTYITPPLTNTTHPTYKSYQSSPNCRRSFCNNCGSSLTFNDDTKPEKTEVMLGTLDEEVLCKREGIGGGEGTLGSEMCRSVDHIWVGNAVKGFTDELLGGKKWKGARGGEEVV